MNRASGAAGCVALIGMLLASEAASAKDKASKPVDKMAVSVTVVSPDGEPLGNAMVRIPDTEGRRDVTPATGTWETDMLYRLDGSEFFFTKGTVLDLTITAPGYEAVNVAWTVRKRKNGITVTLAPLPADAKPTTEDDELMIQWFKRTPVDQGS